MRYPRMTTRRWMAVTTFVALIAWAAALTQHRSRYLLLVARNQALEALYSHRRNIPLDTGGWMLRPDLFDEHGVMKPGHAKAFDRKQAHFARLAEKYRYAARHPWVRVPPDPPEPR